MWLKIFMMSLFVSAAFAQKVDFAKEKVSQALGRGPNFREALNVPKQYSYSSDCSLLWSRESDPFKKKYDEGGLIDSCIKTRKHAMQKHAGCDAELAENGYEPVPVRPPGETSASYRLKMNFVSNCEVKVAKPVPLFKKVPREVVCPNHTIQNDLHGEVDLVVCVPKNERPRTVALPPSKGSDK